MIRLNDKNNLLYGQRRLEACKLLEMEDISVIVKKGNHQKEVERAENVDRKDFTPSEAVEAWQEIEKRNANQYTKVPRSESDRSKPREQASKLTGFGHDTLSKAKQVVESGKQNLIDKITLGNNVDILPDIESNSVDLVLTDPPYVTALADLYKSWNFRNHDFEFYAEQFNRILKDTGQICIFSDYPTSLAIGNAFQKYFRFRFYWTWIKSNGQPVNDKMPRSNVELILVWKKKKTLTRDLVFNPVMRPGEPYRKAHKAGNSTRKQSKSYETINNTGQRWPEQSLYYPSKDNLPRAERTDHPTQKPLGLCGYLIRTLSNENDLILDPFSGSGSTAIACHRLKRKFICIEQDHEFYLESLGRLERERCQETLPF